MMPGETERMLGTASVGKIVRPTDGSRRRLPTQGMAYSCRNVIFTLAFSTAFVVRLCRAATRSIGPICDLVRAAERWARVCRWSADGLVVTRCCEEWPEVPGCGKGD